MTNTYHGYTPQDFRDKYDYNPETGSLTYKKGHMKGRNVGGANKTHGYINTCMTKPDGKNTTGSVHRIVWAMYYDEAPDPKLVIDHINGNITDNRIDNLRLVTPQENSKNASKRRKKKNPLYILTEIPGIKINRKTGIYVASGGGQVLVETHCFDDAKYVRWDWEYENGYHVNHGVKEAGG